MPFEITVVIEGTVCEVYCGSAAAAGGSGAAALSTRLYDHTAGGWGFFADGGEVVVENITLGHARGVMAAGSIRIGTSGWVYQHWRDIFYPCDAEAGGLASHYAATFDTVEVNNSFTGCPARPRSMPGANRPHPAFFTR